MTNTGGTSNPSGNNNPDINALEALAKKLEGYDKRLRDTQSYSQRQLNEKDSEAKRLTEENERLSKYVSELESKQIPNDRKEAEQLMKENPALHKAMMQIAAEMSVNERSKISAELSNWKSTQAKKSQVEQFSIVLNAHPDADEIRRSDDFNDWLQRQSPACQKAIAGKNEDTTADDLILYFDKFKRDTKYKNPNSAAASKNNARKKQVEDSVGVSPKGNTNIPDEDDEFIKQSDINKMSDAEYIKNREKIVQMANEGKLLAGV